jgi:NAD-dependent deacetylase
MTHPRQINIDSRTRVLVLTGAGVSAESGIATFRGSSGLWENHRVEDVASPAGFQRDPALVWRFYSERRAAAMDVVPNRGHVALASLEEKLGDRFLLATQNIDGLHQAAGTRRVIEMHGSLWKTRCTRCARAPFDDRDVYTSQNLPGCGQCDARGEFALLRPHIVWFGEALDPADLSRIDEFLRADAGDRLVFVSCGTSGLVHPAAGIARVARSRGAQTWLVNLELPENASDFEHTVLGKSGEILPELFVVGH